MMRRTLPFCAALWLVAVTACHHQAPRAGKKGKSPRPAKETRASATPALPDFAVDAVATQEGDARWYDVPEQSLPERKAWPGEMTAASDVLPQNGYVRVRRIDGKGEAVVVRITDNGVQRKGTLVDVNRAAAEALGIVKLGMARVRVETLALKNADADKPVEPKDSPAAPKLTNTPAADQKAEKDAANAKTGGQSAP